MGASHLESHHLLLAPFIQQVVSGLWLNPCLTHTEKSGVSALLCALLHYAGSSPTPLRDVGAAPTPRC